eukprot:6192187-Pleurochrysis_carterae.AAC.2
MKQFNPTTHERHELQFQTSSHSKTAKTRARGRACVTFRRQLGEDLGWVGGRGGQTGCDESA